MSNKLGTPFGLWLEATIERYHEDGTVEIALDQGQIYGPPKRFRADLPATWMGPNGEFMGGAPPLKSTVKVIQGIGGRWAIIGYAKSNDVFTQGDVTSDLTKMSALQPGRALIQVTPNNRILVDKKLGTQVGSPDSFIHANPNRNILSHNFQSDLSFTESGFSLHQIVKRDLVENSTRSILSSTWDSQEYEDSLFSIGLDPTLRTSVRTQGNLVRNPGFVEKRELIHEFGHSFGYKTDREESARYQDRDAVKEDPPVDKRDMRSDLLSLSLEHPNHLIETVTGTLVDSAGNILDINRVALPIGKAEGLSLLRNPDKSSAHDKIRAAIRKSVAYHFEINARKGGPPTTPPPEPPSVNDVSDYARSRSKFSLDIDKEGQFKINVPASSEVGNVPLLTRYENYSNLLSQEEDSVDPNAFVRNEEQQDIFLENFATSPNVSLTPAGEPAEYGRAIDRLSEEPIKLGTTFHDITSTLSEFQESAGFRQVDLNLVQFDEDHPLNQTDSPLERVVSEEVIVSGEGANAGGRSGTINLDGMLSLNIGANTVDRQSMWIDMAGGVISRIGRDRQGISYASSLDGDVLIQIGGSGIGNTADSRFSEENDAYRNGKFDLRVLINGQTLIFRMDETGVHVVSPGRMTFWSQQDMIFKTNSALKMEAETIMLYSETSKRIVNRIPANSIG